MIIKTVISLCIFQMVKSQENPEKDLQDLIDQTNQDVEEYVYPTLARRQAFWDRFVEEDRVLQDGCEDLREELENLAFELSNGTVNVSTCLHASSENVYAIYEDRFEEQAAFHTAEFNIVNLVLNDFTLVFDEILGLISGTRDSIEACKALVTAEEVNECYSLLITLFDELKNDALNRMIEIYQLGQDAFTVAEEAQQNFSDGNKLFVNQTLVESLQELTNCIQEL
ncbi:hypothetical protein L9F63_009112 [Diploptera punctata]|uniref:Uncharacterized protein n=1 Tax=Diploptera punctata TaxID=6984 RepID=A0AAD7Z4X1_DIPPU|nr:hypothetical protein L9F63_009112 [Diploptera punctata]